MLISQANSQAAGNFHQSRRGFHGSVFGDRIFQWYGVVKQFYNFLGITDFVGSYSHKLFHCDRFFNINLGFLTASERGWMLAFTILSHFWQGDRPKIYRPPLDKLYYSMLLKHKAT
ncbi:hypothetical protein [Microcoleus sp. B3-D7]|uniref:hypothetical protein n=1 Tax=Microcoleus sp. B3-D7 TaxID=2818659 RepID=UPI002FD2B57F